MSMKLHGVVISAALNCFQASFCDRLIFHVFRFGVPKPTLRICLITLVVISFRCCIIISKLNMLLWAAVLWLSCNSCNCCVDSLLLLWLSALKKFAAFAKWLHSWPNDLGNDILLLFLRVLLFLESELFLRFLFSSD